MYTIRPCSENDLEQVLQLSKQWAQEDVTIGYENVKHTVEKLGKFIGDYFQIAARENDPDKVVGFTFGKIKQGAAGPVISAEEPYLEIFEVYVHPEHRGRKLGSLLVKELIAKAESNQISRALVGSSNRRWKDTVDFYEELGFSMWYVQMVR